MPPVAHLAAQWSSVCALEYMDALSCGSRMIRLKVCCAATVFILRESGKCSAATAQLHCNSSSHTTHRSTTTNKQQLSSNGRSDLLQQRSHVRKAEPQRTTCHMLSHQPRQRNASAVDTVRQPTVRYCCIKRDMAVLPCRTPNSTTTSASDSNSCRS